MQTFTDRVVVITGGGAGIGRAAAREFAAQGARVIVTGRRPEPLQTLADSIPNISVIVADVANEHDAGRTISEVIARFGRLDVVVNNAGAGQLLPLADASPDKVRNIFEVNVFGATLLASAALPYLKESRGNIVNVSSTYGHKAGAGLSHYAASKAALEHLTRCWALELAPLHVRVNAIAAGPTETEFLTERMGLSYAGAEAIKAEERSRIPLGRRGTPHDVAHWIVAVASPNADWMTGQVIGVDGGLGLA